MASECARKEVQIARDVWITKRQSRMQLEPHRPTFLDETSVNTKMVPSRGSCLRGERLQMDAPFGHWNTQTFIAGLRCYELVAPRIIGHAMNRISFETYIETRLAPTLSPGDVVILDNLAVHKSQKAADMVKERQAWLLLLPPYSLELNLGDHESNVDRNVTVRCCALHAQFSMHFARMLPGCKYFAAKSGLANQAEKASLMLRVFGLMLVTYPAFVRIA
jgi:hypothetical protein